MFDYFVFAVPPWNTFFRGLCNHFLSCNILGKFGWKKTFCGIKGNGQTLCLLFQFVLKHNSLMLFNFLALITNILKKSYLPKRHALRFSKLFSAGLCFPLEAEWCSCWGNYIKKQEIKITRTFKKIKYKW